MQVLSDVITISGQIGWVWGVVIALFSLLFGIIWYVTKQFIINHHNTLLRTQENIETLLKSTTQENGKVIHQKSHQVHLEKLEEALLQHAEQCKYHLQHQEEIVKLIREFATSSNIFQTKIEKNINTLEKTLVELFGKLDQFVAKTLDIMTIVISRKD